jgi:hypothetical protein
MTVGISTLRHLPTWRARRGAGLLGLVVPLVSGMIMPALAGDVKVPTTRHAALVTALRALDSGNPADTARAHAILMSVSPRGLDAQDNPARELVAVYDLEALSLPPSRGHIRGPVMRSGRLDAAVEEMSMVFEGGEKADVTLYAQGDQTLEVTAAETVLCRSQAQDGVASCSWMPMFSKSHTIRIVREDTQSRPYTLIVN